MIGEGEVFWHARALRAEARALRAEDIAYRMTDWRFSWEGAE